MEILGERRLPDVEVTPRRFDQTGWDGAPSMCVLRKRIPLSLSFRKIYLKCVCAHISRT